MFTKFEFTKSWLDPSDFPTIETDEGQVRQDLQYLHEETKQAIWALIDALASAEGAGGIGVQSGDDTADLQTVMTQLLQTAHEHEDTEELERLCGAFRGLAVTDTLTDDSTLIPTAKAVLEQMKETGLADMLQAIYDPDGKKTDIFAYADSAAAARAPMEHDHADKAPLTHSHKAEEITDGILPIENGGTGAATAEEARNNLSAAAKAHSHAVADLVSGSLSLERGGTGSGAALMNAPANAIIAKDLTQNSLNGIATASGALYASGSGAAAKFGVLPIAQGGTGAATAAAARANLGAAEAASLQFQMFYSLAELGLTASATTAEVFEAMPEKSTLFFSNSANSSLRITDAPTSFCLIEMIRNTNYGSAKAFKINAAATEEYFGSWYDGGLNFSGWFSLNPAMYIGNEYKTAEWWNGKPVYCKLVDCGTVTSGAQITYSAEAVTPIRYCGYCSAGVLPVLLEDAFSGNWKLWAYVTGSVINIYMGSMYTGGDRVYLQVYYVKS